MTGPGNAAFLPPGTHTIPAEPALPSHWQCLPCQETPALRHHREHRSLCGQARDPTGKERLGRSWRNRTGTHLTPANDRPPTASPRAELTRPRRVSQAKTPSRTLPGGATKRPTSTGPAYPHTFSPTQVHPSSQSNPRQAGVGTHRPTGECTPQTRGTGRGRPHVGDHDPQRVRAKPSPKSTTLHVSHPYFSTP